MKFCICGQPATRLLTFTVRRLDTDEPPAEYEGALCERHFDMTHAQGNKAAREMVADAVARIGLTQPRPASKS